jgi:hypothetical protein
MPASVIAISRTMGAEAESVGSAVAERLGFRFVDEDIVAAAAAKYQLEAGVVADAERRRPLVVRVLEELGSADWSYPGQVISKDQVIKTDDMRAIIREAIHEIAAQGNVVIFAHAASMALAGQEGLLRVLLTASPDVRARRLANGGMSEAEAMKEVKASDRDRADYLKRFYQIEVEQPTHYDLVLNTDRLTPEETANVVAAAAAA